MAFPPGGGYRICLVNHERIKTSPAGRPGSRQAGRASADDHDTLLHDASVDPRSVPVNKTHPARTRTRIATFPRGPVRGSQVVRFVRM